MAILPPDPTIRTRVLASARRLLQADPQVPLSRIAAEAGVSRATFYRHFGSRGALLREVDVAPAPGARDRVLEAAVAMLQHRPLSQIAMEEVAVAAGVSRATLYRLYSGKPQLLGALVERYSPFDEALEVLERHAQEPPQVVLPMLARAVVHKALPRRGVVRSVLIETTSAVAENAPAVGPLLQRAIGALTAYLESQMEAGHLRRMHPLLALQSVIGPVAFHILTRPVAGQVLALDVDAEDAAAQLTAVAVRGLLP